MRAQALSSLFHSISFVTHTSNVSFILQLHHASKGVHTYTVIILWPVSVVCLCMLPLAHLLVNSVFVLFEQPCVKSLIASAKHTLGLVVGLVAHLRAWMG